MKDSSGEIDRLNILSDSSSVPLKLVSDVNCRQADYELLPLQLIPNNDDEDPVVSKKRKKKQNVKNSGQSPVQDDSIMAGLQTVIDLCGLLDRYDLYSNKTNTVEASSNQPNPGTNPFLSSISNGKQFSDLSTFYSIIPDQDRPSQSRIGCVPCFNNNFPSYKSTYNDHKSHDSGDENMFEPLNAYFGNQFDLSLRNVYCCSGEKVPSCCREPTPERKKKKKKKSKRDKTPMKNECCIPDCCRDPDELAQRAFESELLCKEECCLTKDQRRQKIGLMKSLQKPDCCLSADQREKKALLKDCCVAPEERCREELLKRKECCLTKEEKRQRKLAMKDVKKGRKIGYHEGFPGGGLCSNASNKPGSSGPTGLEVTCRTYEELQKEKCGQIPPRGGTLIKPGELQNEIVQNENAQKDNVSRVSEERPQEQKYPYPPPYPPYYFYPPIPDQRYLGGGFYPPMMYMGPNLNIPNNPSPENPVRFDTVATPESENLPKTEENAKENENNKEDDRSPIVGLCAKHKKFKCTRPECCRSPSEQKEKEVCEEHGVYGCTKPGCCKNPSNDEPVQETTDNCCKMLTHIYERPRKAKPEKTRKKKSTNCQDSDEYTGEYCCGNKPKYIDIRELDDCCLTPEELEMRRRERTPDCCLTEAEVLLKHKEIKEGRKQRKIALKEEKKDMKEAKKRIENARKSAAKQKSEEQKERHWVEKEQAEIANISASIDDDREPKNYCCLKRDRSRTRTGPKACPKTCQTKPMPLEHAKKVEKAPVEVTPEEQELRRREKLMEALLQQQADAEREKHAKVAKPASPSADSRKVYKFAKRYNDNGHMILVPIDDNDGSGELGANKSGNEGIIICVEENGKFVCYPSKPDAAPERDANDTILYKDQEGKFVVTNRNETVKETPPQASSPEPDELICTEPGKILICQSSKDGKPNIAQPKTLIITPTDEGSATPATPPSIIKVSDQEMNTDLKSAEKTGQSESLLIQTDAKPALKREVQIQNDVRPCPDLCAVHGGASTASSSYYDEEWKALREACKLCCMDKLSVNHMPAVQIVPSEEESGDAPAKASAEPEKTDVDESQAEEAEDDESKVEEEEEEEDDEEDESSESKSSESVSSEEDSPVETKKRKKVKAKPNKPPKEKQKNKGSDKPSKTKKNRKATKSSSDYRRSRSRTSVSSRSSSITSTKSSKSSTHGKKRKKSKKDKHEHMDPERVDQSKLFMGLPCGTADLLKKTEIDCRKSRLTIPVPVVQPVVGVCTDGICGGDATDRVLGIRYAQVKITEFTEYCTYEVMRGTSKKPYRMSTFIEQLFVTKKPKVDGKQKKKWKLKRKSSKKSSSHKHRKGSHKSNPKSNKSGESIHKSKRQSRKSSPKTKKSSSNKKKVSSNKEKSSSNKKKSSSKGSKPNRKESKTSEEKLKGKLSKKKSQQKPTKNNGVGFSNEVLIKKKSSKNKCCSHKKMNKPKPIAVIPKECSESKKCPSECTVSRTCKKRRTQLRKTRSKTS